MMTLPIGAFPIARVRYRKNTHSGLISSQSERENADVFSYGPRLLFGRALGTFGQYSIQLPELRDRKLIKGATD